jgi:hypothetical protein
MPLAITVTILAILTSIWTFLTKAYPIYKIVVTIAKAIANFLFLLSRLPGDLTLHIIQNQFPAYEQQILKVILYLNSGIFSVLLVIWAFRFMFG